MKKRLSETKQFENSNVLIVIPTTFEEMAFYGANTKWTLSQATSKIKNYFEARGGYEGNLRIYINKKTNEKILEDIKRGVFYNDFNNPLIFHGRTITELPEWTNVHMQGTDFDQTFGFFDQLDENKNMKKVIRLNEKDIEGLVRKIMTEERKQPLNEMDRAKLYELSDVHDDVLYLKPGYHNEGNYANAIEIYYTIKYIVNGENIPKEARELINRIEYDISGLEGIDHRVVQLYEILERTFLNENINEAWPKRELERKATSFRRSDFKPYKREKDVQKIFGKYSEDVPPQVIQYMRKNPASIIRRLVDIYGIDEVYNYIDMATGDTMPPMEENYNMDEMMTEAKKKKQEKFIQKAQKSIEKRGTEGSFKEYCGGEVTMACIQKGLKSDDPAIVKKANYAKNIGGYKGAKHKK